MPQDGWFQTLVLLALPCLPRFHIHHNSSFRCLSPATRALLQAQDVSYSSFSPLRPVGFDMLKVLDKCLLI